MKLHPMKLVTVVCEALARDALVRLLTEVGAHGYTLFPAEGQGAQGRRTDDIREFSNIQMEVIVPPEVAERLLAQVEAEFIPRYAMVAFESDIRVLRPQKF